jgi:hypothetical protein
MAPSFFSRRHQPQPIIAPAVDVRGSGVCKAQAPSQGP